MSRSTSALVFGLAWAASFGAARWFLETPGLATGLKLLLAFGPSVPLLGFVWAAVGMARDADEMERRVQIEGLAFGFGGALVLIATLALAQRAGYASYDDFSYAHLLPMLVFLYFTGIMLGRRRYACAPE